MRTNLFLQLYLDLSDNLQLKTEFRMASREIRKSENVGLEIKRNLKDVLLGKMAGRYTVGKNHRLVFFFFTSVFSSITKRSNGKIW